MMYIRCLAQRLLFAGAMAGWVASVAHAATVNESFAGASTGPGWTLAGSAALTGTGIPDPVGSGWLRLTPAIGAVSGFAYHDLVLPISVPITVTFEFAEWGGSTPPADGMTFFLFDAAGGFTVGDGGGGFGYTSMPTGALAVGIGDDYPSFFVNSTPDSIAVRGPGPATGFVSGTAGLSPTPGTPARGLTPADANFRRITITIVPAGAGTVAVTVQLRRGGAVSTVLSNVVVTGLPATVRFGVSAATGGATNTHEVRNFSLVSGDGTAAIPTLSEWGTVALAALLVIGSFAALRGR
jgi:Bacterial lectin/IPTL-CTERM motif